MNTAPIARVVPRIRVAPNVALLDYAIPAHCDVEVGDVVSIPFRTRTIEGVVWELAESTELQNVRALECTENPAAYTPEQLALFRWMEQETLTPLNVLFRTGLPAEKAVRRKVVTATPKSHGTVWRTLDQRQAIATQLAEKIRVAAGPSLILVPSESYAQLWQKVLGNVQVCTLIGPTTSRVYRSQLQHLASAKVIITTHVGLFAPLPRLAHVLIDVADDDGYLAFDQSPRVDLRNVAAALARFHGATLHLLARWQSPQLLKLLPAGVSWIQLPQQWTGVVVDRSTEPTRERNELISHTLREKLEPVRTLWLLNRTGEAGRLVCADCGTVVTCPTCNEPLHVQQAQSQELICKRDNTRVLRPARCGKCKSPALSLRALGVQALATYLQHAFPNTEVAVMDARTVRGDVMTATHVVATTAIQRELQARFHAAVIVRADSILSTASYRADEELVATVAFVGQYLQPKGTVYVQTYQAQAASLQHLAAQDYGAVQLLEQRRSFKYPPAATIVLLTPRQRVRNLAAQPLEHPAGEVLQATKDAWLLRFSQEEREQRLHNLLRELDPTWTATVDPPRLTR